MGGGETILTIHPYGWGKEGGAGGGENGWVGEMHIGVVVWRGKKPR